MVQLNESQLAMSFFIRGLGTAVPTHTVTQTEAAALARKVICQNEQQERLLTALYRKAGVNVRHTVLPYQTALRWLPVQSGDVEAAARTVTRGPTTGERMQLFAEHAAPLAEQAAREALTDAKVDARSITHLITVTCTGFYAPGLDTALIKGLGLRPTTQRVQVGFMGCHGAINGLRVAQALTSANPAACVLLCAVELCSLHYCFHWDPEQIVANAIFADGAAAIVGGNRMTEDDRAWNVLATGSCLLPDSEEAMTWRIDDYGFEMALQARLPDLIGEHLRPWLAAWLTEQGQSLDAIRSWAIHPGGPRILSAVENSLHLPRETTAASHEILAYFGNMSSPTVLFIIDRLRKAEAIRPCVALGFGPGMFAETALLL